MKKHELIETVVRIEVLLGELKKDMEEIKQLEKRIGKLEKFDENIKGYGTGAMLVSGVALAAIWGKLKLVLGL